MKKTKQTKPKSTKLKPVIVTTAHRGVFFGYAGKTSGETIVLRKARLCVYWSKDMQGFMGLASQGPSTTCRIGPPADIELRNITAVIGPLAPDVVAKWEASPWSA
jgi:hypothetical protein